MDELTTRSEMSETTTAPKADEQPTREGSQLKQFKVLFDGEPGETPAKGNAAERQQNAKPKTGDAKAKPKALKELAERLQLAPEDLYAIEVPMAEGKSLSIGKLKDAAAAQEQLTVRELAFEERVSKQEAEWTRAQQELNTLMSHIDPKAIKPELREKVRQQVESDLKREREAVLKAIPEWQNETVRETELAGIVEHLKDFGIHESFLTATMNHKLFRLVRDAYLRKVRTEKALAQVIEVKKPSTTGRSSAGTGAARKVNGKADRKLSPRWQEFANE